jgi:prevent-host-death family protein
VNIREAKTHLSRLLQRVAAGEEVTIARSGIPVARLVAVEAKAKSPLGFARSRTISMPPPDDWLAAFYGGEIPKLESKTKKARGRRRKLIIFSTP